jgi:molecular chaperone DnaK
VIITRAIGIDLGTTNSEAALLDPNERDLILWKDGQGRPVLPSCVWWDIRKGDIIVGYRAYARKGTKPGPISSIKRSMGTQMTVDLGGVQRSPADISSYILHELKTQMEAELKRRSSDVQYDVSRAIITVPAYFGLPAIEATRQAGELAGLEVVELLHEPTAAAIYYSWKHNLGDGNYLVYDLGGGTFDVSILHSASGEFLVLGISGDIFLGGDDFDRRLAEYLRAMLVAEGYDLDLDVSSNPEDRLRFNQLMTLAERAKKELSKQNEIVLRDQGTIRDKSDNPVVVETSISRIAFEELIEDLLDRTLVFCEDALEKACHKSGVSIENIDHILLVGGSTYMPAVFNKVKKAFCDGPRRARCPEPIRDEPETAVALGAALRAAASGLGIGDDNKCIRLWFRGTGATKNEQTMISGRVEPIAKDLCLEGGLLRLTNSSGDLLGDVELKSNLTFVFPKVALQAESLNTFKFEVLDDKRKLVAVLQRSIVHASDQKEAVGNTLSTAVLSKPIILEGTDGDRLVRQVLLADGTSLPAKSQFTFSVADHSGHLRMPIYQENRIIKELVANIGNIVVGTPVRVEIECDEQVRIQVQFWIGDKKFGGKIDPPPADAVPTEYDVEQIDRHFDEALRLLDVEDAQRLSNVYRKARQDLDEARSGADYSKVIQRAADLEGLVCDARLAEPLHPQLDVVENHFDSCLELLPQAAKIISVVSMRNELEEALKKAMQAYQRRDRQAYKDASQIIDASLQFLASVTRVRVTEDKDIDIAIRAIMAIEKTRKTMQFLFMNCMITDQRDFLTEIRQGLEVIDQLEEIVSGNPVEVLNRCQVLSTEAQRIYKQIIPEKKIGADLEGLLRVDTRKAMAHVDMPLGLFDRE